MPVAMPSQQDLIGAYGDWNPMTYIQAQQQYQNQAGLANQFSQNELAQKQEELAQTQRMNPLRVQEAELMNTGKATANKQSDLTYQNSLRDFQNRQSIPQADEQKALRSKLMTELSDAEIKQAESHIRQMALSPDPKIRAAGIQGMQGFQEFVKQREALLSAQKVANIHADTSRYVADKSAEARLGAAKARAPGTSSFEDVLGKAKEPRQKYSLLVDMAARVEADNPELAASYRARAMEQKAAAEAQLAAGGRPNAVIDPTTGQLVYQTNAEGVKLPAPGGKPNLLSKLPPGSKDNGDGTFTLPDGRRVKPKGQ